MKEQLIILFLIFGILGCQSRKNSVIITGKIKGQIPEKLEYSIPVSGICHLSFRESVQPDSLGNFQINIVKNEPVFIRLILPNKEIVTIVAEPDNEYELNFDLNTDRYKVEFVGKKNSQGQKIYNSLPNDDDIAVKSGKIAEIVEVTNLNLKFDTLKNNEIKLFKSLYDNNEISDAFLSLVKLDRDCYYSTLMATVLQEKYKQLNKKNDDAKKQILRTSGKLFDNLHFPSMEFSKSPSFYLIVTNFLTYKVNIDKTPMEDFNLDIRSLGTYYLHKNREVKKYFAGDFLEFQQAILLADALIQKRNEKELITIFNEFKSDFPNSEYIEYFSLTVESIVEYHKKIEEPFNENTHFINRDEINSLTDCVRQFKGKKVYVDIWASWCGPCKEEFTFKNELNRLLRSNNIEMLYVSIDHDNRDEEWKNMIKFHDLEGYHIRANSEFSANLYKLYNNNGTMTIPWNILIDEDGNIIKMHASHPSQLEQLEKEIK